MPKFVSVCRPAWTITDTELRRWQKIHGIFLHRGLKAQVVIVDVGDPIMILLQRPIRLTRDEEGGAITGTFVLNERDVRWAEKQRPRQFIKPVFTVALFCRKAKAFVYHCEGHQLPLIMNHPDGTYIEKTEERKRVLELIEGVPCNGKR